MMFVLARLDTKRNGSHLTIGMAEKEMAEIRRGEGGGIWLNLCVLTSKASEIQWTHRGQRSSNSSGRTSIVIGLFCRVRSSLVGPLATAVTANGLVTSSCQ